MKATKVDKNNTNIISNIDKNSNESDNESIDETLCEEQTNLKINKSEERLNSCIGLEKDKKKKKRRRSRKKKSESNPSEVIKKESTESQKLSVLRPEVVEGLVSNKEKRVSLKSNVLDELSHKIKQIQCLKIEDLLEVTFWQKFVQRTGRVVAITKALHSRKAGGRPDSYERKEPKLGSFYTK